MSGPWAVVGQAYNPIYQASSDIISRQLFVNGIRATPASLGPIPGSNVTITAEGYITNDGTILDWWQQQPFNDVGASPFEFVYTGVGASTWTEPRCSTAGISSDGNGGAVIQMQQPCWANARGRNNGNQAVTYPTSISNAYAGLQQATFGGQFFASYATSELYYVPRDGENMDTADVRVPVLEQLVVVNGSYNLQFIGITWAYSTWNLPSGPFGYVDNQSGYIYTGNPGHTQQVPTPGAITVYGARNVTFAGCTFTHLGSTALLVAGSSQYVSIVNNTFTDISGGAITLGQVDDAGQTDPSVYNGYHTVFNNFIEQTPVEYHGCAAILGGYLVDTTITHNHIVAPSNGGICVGWGWGSPVSYAGGHYIGSNRIERSNSVLKDCGSIYVNGHQVKSSTMENNYVYDQVNLFGSLYPDEGSSFWAIRNNVAENDPEWLHIWTSSINNIVVEGNYYGPGNYSIQRGTNCTVTNNTWVPEGAIWPAAAEDIKAQAGLV